jgi:hypothetical protein
MQSQMDTLDKLADKLGLDRTGPEFGRVWAHLKAEAWTPDEAARDFRGAVKSARSHLRVIKQWARAFPAGGKQKARGDSSWRGFAAALERHAADLARQDAEVLAFRCDVLNGRLVSPTELEVQSWLRAHPQHHEDLTRLAQTLAQGHWWTTYDALVFVLTNEMPPRSPLRIQMQGTTGSMSPPRIIVEAEAWVPPAQIARAFRHVRDRMQRGSRRRARTVSPRAVALVAFVERTPGSWRDRVAAWNTANPGARFTDRANLRRTYEAARRRLVPPTNLVAVTRRDAPPQPVFFVGR